MITSFPEDPFKFGGDDITFVGRDELYLKHFQSTEILDIQDEQIGLNWRFHTLYLPKFSKLPNFGASCLTLLSKVILFMWLSLQFTGCAEKAYMVRRCSRGGVRCLHIHIVQCLVFCVTCSVCCVLTCCVLYGLQICAM